jgi:hypothetical protein
VIAEEVVVKTVSVEGLPGPVAAAVLQMVETLRAQFTGPREPCHPVELPRWPGKVLGNLTREEIYADVR